MTSTNSEVTIGIDIGTSSVKALAVDADGKVVRSVRVRHQFFVPSPQRLEHDASCWSDGPVRALDELGAADLAPKAVSVAAMVPSLCAIGTDGRAVTSGLLYGDERGHPRADDPAESDPGELGRFLRWLTTEAPMARGYWPAQAVANFALCGEAVLSTTAAAACWPLFNFRGWDERLVVAAGGRTEQMPRLAPSGAAAGEVNGLPGCVLEGGSIDAMSEQIVAGCDEAGDVLVICGTTLITWKVTESVPESSAYMTIPHTTADRFLVGGPSNAGGLFLDWARRLSAEDGLPPRPGNVPIWVPYPRGERSPLDDSQRRAQLHDLDLTHTAAAIRRAAYEAAGFVVRRSIEGSEVPARRIVATGGGVRATEWIQCLADATGLPVEVVAVPEGAALGTAWIARQAAGLEQTLDGARRWARTARTVEPDPQWSAAVDDRYGRWLELAS